MRQLKHALLTASKLVGLFRLAGYLTGGGLRILCFHGVSLADEHRFRPKLFMQADTFEGRLALLQRHGFPVLPLGEAVERLREGTLPPRAVAITVDDGFYGTYGEAMPRLRRLGMPATLYVTSYYVLKPGPVFELVVQYMFWKTRRVEVDLGGLGPATPLAVSLRDEAAQKRVMHQIIDYGNAQGDEAVRSELLRKLGARLGVDYEEIIRRRLFGLMSLEEVRDLAAQGVDVQAHTHRHCFPEEEWAARKELADNRAVLEPATGRRLEHFCYPSGVWSARHWPWLASEGMKTATTCDEGLNYPGTPVLALRRFIDGEDVSTLEFEAELSGFSELVRTGRQAIRRLLEVGGARSLTCLLAAFAP